MAICRFAVNSSNAGLFLPHWLNLVLIMQDQDSTGKKVCPE
jgi:hypothetical protein